jgi:hypothetical protein
MGRKSHASRSDAPKRWQAEASGVNTTKPQVQRPMIAAEPFSQKARNAPQACQPQVRKPNQPEGLVHRWRVKGV